MSRRRTPPDDAPAPIPCPFTILVDTNEYLPQHCGWRFDGEIRANADKRYARILPRTTTAKIRAADYSIVEQPTIFIERKTKADLYGSIVARDNFIERLEIMESRAMRDDGYAAIVVECNDADLLIPPPETEMRPKAVSRTVLAWRQRYRVDWYFCSGRDMAEMTAFRMLETHWNNTADRRN